MRSRAFREGSVGLLILGGLGLFVWLILWVRGIGLGEQSYDITVAFENSRGIQVGTALRYRGVQIGKAVSVEPRSDVVNVRVRVTKPDLLVPSQSIIEAQSTALLGESFMDIVPLEPLPTGLDLAGPTDPNCVRDIILCDGSTIEGIALADIGDLIRATNQLAQVFTDPELLSKLDRLTNNAVEATAGISSLGRDLSKLSQSAESEISKVSVALEAVTAAADQMSDTVTQAGDVLDENRAVIGQTLDNFRRSSDSLVTVLDNLAPLIAEVGEGDLLTNFEQFSNNARRASAQLLVATRALNNPANIQVLQETLDAARVTFQNAQKLTSDLDDLTGDPETRRNLRLLINTLGDFFSAAQDLEEQIQPIAEPEPDVNDTVDLETKAVDWKSWKIPEDLQQSLNLSGEAVLTPNSDAPEDLELELNNQDQAQQ